MSVIQTIAILTFIMLGARDVAGQCVSLGPASATTINSHSTFPSNYDNDYSKCWSIKTSGSDRIKVHIYKDLETENLKDNLIIYDGETSSAGQVAALSVSVSSTMTYSSTSNSMSLYFTTDNSGKGMGFQFCYCDESSPGWPCSSTDCTWTDTSNNNGNNNNNNNNNNGNSGNNNNGNNNNNNNNGNGNIFSSIASSISRVGDGVWSLLPILLLILLIGVVVVVMMVVFVFVIVLGTRHGPGVGLEQGLSQRQEKQQMQTRD